MMANNITNNTKIIYSRRVAFELRKKGFKILRTEPNRYKPELDTYIFESTQELNDAISEILDWK